MSLENVLNIANKIDLFIYVQVTQTCLAVLLLQSSWCYFLAFLFPLLSLPGLRKSISDLCNTYSDNKFTQSINNCYHTQGLSLIHI